MFKEPLRFFPQYEPVRFKLDHPSHLPSVRTLWMTPK